MFFKPLETANAGRVMTQFEGSCKVYDFATSDSLAQSYQLFCLMHDNGEKNDVAPTYFIRYFASFPIEHDGLLFSM